MVSFSSFIKPKMCLVGFSSVVIKTLEARSWLNNDANSSLFSSSSSSASCLKMKVLSVYLESSIVIGLSIFSGSSLFYFLRSLLLLFSSDYSSYLRLCYDTATSQALYFFSICSVCEIPASLIVFVSSTQE